MISTQVRTAQSRLARRATIGRGIGIAEAVTAAEAAVETLRDNAISAIADMLYECEAHREAVRRGEQAAFNLLRLHAEALVGLAATFGRPEIGRAALSMLQLFDATAPLCPSSKAVLVHLDALLMFSILTPEGLRHSAREVLDGLVKVVESARRHAVTLV